MDHKIWQNEAHKTPIIFSLTPHKKQQWKRSFFLVVGQDEKTKNVYLNTRMVTKWVGVELSMIFLKGNANITWLNIQQNI